MDFQRIVDDVEIRMNVPLHFIGEDVAPGVKAGGGSVSRLLNDVEVSCLPKYLPEYLDVDISELELDEMLNLSEIKLPEGVEIPQLAPGIDNDQPMVSIHVIKEIVIEEEELEGEALEAGEEGEVAEGDESAADTSGEESSDE
jgi:large subunit ribosomal protein L25